MELALAANSAEVVRKQCTYWWAIVPCRRFGRLDTTANHKQTWDADGY